MIRILSLFINCELFCFSGLKQYFYISVCGVLLVLFGESLRKASMITASTNFNHYVQYVKRPGHQLVTRGVYSWCRHPSYVGWFYWSVGTQVFSALGWLEDLNDSSLIICKAAHIFQK